MHFLTGVVPDIFPEKAVIAKLYEDAPNVRLENEWQLQN
jgi:hypothetical protein